MYKHIIFFAGLIFSSASHAGVATSTIEKLFQPPAPTPAPISPDGTGPQSTVPQIVAKTGTPAKVLDPSAPVLLPTDPTPAPYVPPKLPPIDTGPLLQSLNKDARNIDIIINSLNSDMPPSVLKAQATLIAPQAATLSQKYANILAKNIPEKYRMRIQATAQKYSDISKNYQNISESSIPQTFFYHFEDAQYITLMSGNSLYRIKKASLTNLNEWNTPEVQKALSLVFEKKLFNVVHTQVGCNSKSGCVALPQKINGRDVKTLVGTFAISYEKIDLAGLLWANAAETRVPTPTPPAPSYVPPPPPIPSTVFTSATFKFLNYGGNYLRFNDPQGRLVVTSKKTISNLASLQPYAKVVDFAMKTQGTLRMTLSCGAPNSCTTKEIKDTSGNLQGIEIVGPTTLSLNQGDVTHLNTLIPK